MKTTIKKLCKELEKEQKIKILFCVESGSRVWGLESKNSDYDVRFIFARNLKEYIQINQPNDVITKHYDKKGMSCSAEGCYLDFCGFDIFKFARMLSSSNPQVIEWLQSNILYYGKRNKIFTQYALTNFKPISLYYHYKSQCRSNYLKYLKSGNQVTYKKYLYAMRGALNSLWIVKYKSLPPLNFNKTIELINK